MGAKLMTFYDQAMKIGQIKAQMRLAMISGLPSSRAKAEPDSPENISKMQEAMKKVQAEFN